MTDEKSRPGEEFTGAAQDARVEGATGQNTTGAVRRWRIVSGPYRPQQDNRPAVVCLPRGRFCDHPADPSLQDSGTGQPASLGLPRIQDVSRRVRAARARVLRRHGDQAQHLNDQVAS